MPAYPDSPNADLLDRIPLDARRGAGCRLRHRCARRGLSAAQSARAAARHRQGSATPRRWRRSGWTRSASVDVEADPLPFELDRPIDCIIYGDVIEHLRDPWTVLRRHVEALSDDGTILICVPNLEHWSFADRLLRGTWDYEPSGLLDAHASALVQPGDHAQGTARGWACAVRRASAYLRCRRRRRLSPLRSLRRCRAWHRSAGLCRSCRAAAVCLARAQTAAQRLTVVAQHAAPVGGVSHVRVVYPLQAMSSDPTVTTAPGHERRTPLKVGRRCAAHLRAAPPDADRRAAAPR